MKFDPYYISLLYQYEVPEIVIQHSIAVARYVDEIAMNMIAKGIDIDIELAVNGALIHDIGRSRTHDVTHGIEGARIVRELGLDDSFAKICERHIGAGIPEKEAEELGMPPGTYVPETIEEKLIAHCDNLIFGVNRVSLSDTLEKFKNKVGQHSLERIKLLYSEFEAFM